MAAPPTSRSDAPVRAITSNLFARSLPSVPPASQTYEPLARSVLSHRLRREIYPFTAAYAWIVTAAWVSWNASHERRVGVFGMLGCMVWPGTVLAAGLVWVFNVLPIIVHRKSDVSATPTPASSPAQILRTAYSKPATRSALLLHLTTSLSFIVIQLSISRFSSFDDDLRLNLFVKSRKHPYYLNGRFIYLVLAQFTFAAAYHVRGALLDRAIVRWKATPDRSPASRWTQRAFFVFFPTLFLILGVQTLFTLAFVLARAILLPILLTFPFLSSVLRPFCAHFVRGAWMPWGMLNWRNAEVVSRTFLMGVSLISMWDFTETLFDEKIRMNMTLAPQTADPGLTLVSGATSTDTYFKYFAYRELRDFASDDSNLASERRSALFGDQKHSPTLWATLVRDALLFLGHDYQRLLNRGKPAPPPATSATPAPKSKAPEPPATPAQRAPVFQMSKSGTPVRSAIDALASDGTLSQAIESSANVFTQSVSVPKPVVEIEKRVEGAVAEVKDAAKGKGLSGRVAGVLPGNVRAGAKGLGAWWSGERAGKVAESILPNRELDALVVDVLSHLVCASLTEDKYGVVQRDIPRILESMLAYLQALEDYQTELNASSASPEELERAGDVLAVPVDALKMGVVRVVKTFGSKLGAFKFPPVVARKLQGFMDYA
ncbi:hypothetical protein PENSPDRAFT_678351 [Peniophora sp. CONT]|nr:hypothetical protein PENSPDRAFT_678351 [Peniophora sp. CONT]